MSKAWPTVALGEVLSPAVREHPVDPSREYPLLGVRLDGQGPFHRETVLGTQISAPRLYEVKSGDFIYSRLFAWRGAFGLIGRDLDGYFVSNEFPTFTPKGNLISPKYLRYWFRLPDVLRRVEADCSGSTPLTRNRYKEQYFCSLQLPLPPFDEQCRIVSRIEELAAKVEEARSLRAKAHEGGHALKTSAAAHALQALTKEAPRLPLGSLVTVRGGGTPSKDTPHFWGGDVPWITPKDMKLRVLTDAIDHITKAATEKSPAKLLEPGAVLVVVRGMILVHTFPAAVLQVPATINQDMKALIPDARLLPEYLCAVLWAWNSRVLQMVDRSSHDTRKLNTDKLLSFKVPVPSIPVQKRVIAELDALRAKVDAVEALQVGTAAELDAMLPAILNKAFKGEL